MCLEMMNAKFRNSRQQLFLGERRYGWSCWKEIRAVQPDLLLRVCFVVAMSLAPYASMSIFSEQHFLPAPSLLYKGFGFRGFRYQGLGLVFRSVLMRSRKHTRGPG